MPTYDFTTGFETGDFSEFDSTAGAGVSVQGSTVRTGSFALQATGAGADYATKNIAGSPTAHVARFYYRMTGNPSGARSIPYRAAISTTTISFEITLTGIPRVYKNNSGTQLGTDPSALSANTWYLFDLSVDSSGSSWPVAWRIINDSTQATVTNQSVSTGSMTGGGATAFDVGNRGTSTHTQFIDDIAISSTLGDYPIGAGVFERGHGASSGLLLPSSGVSCYGTGE